MVLLEILLWILLKQVMPYKVEPVTGPHILGEGPHWDDMSENLYFVDDLGSSIYRYRPSENKETFCKIHDSAPVSIVIPMKDSANKFVVTIGRNLTVVTWDGESKVPENIELIATVDDEPGKETNQFNDGKVDPTGRLWVGTMGAIKPDGGWTPEKGSLYSFQKNSKPVKHLENLSISNGMTWSKDQTKMFYIDSPTKKIDVFDFDGRHGQISKRRSFFDVSPYITKENSGPDGMTIDENDNIWFAVFGAGIILNVNGTSGRFIRKIDLPIMNPTSVAFGGKHLDQLYVTSATYGVTEDAKKLYPASGSTLRVTGLGVTGRKPFLPRL